MKRALAVFGLLFGIAVVGRAGTPQDAFYQGQAPLSGATIIGSTASPTSVGNYTITVATPTSINSGGSTYTGRNCFTRFIVQVPTTTVVTMYDGATLKWTIYGAGLGTAGTNSLSLPEDHLGPFCIAANDAFTAVLTNTGGAATPSAFDYEGFTTYGGTNNAGPMY